MYMLLQLGSSKIIRWLYPRGNACVIGGNVTRKRDNKMPAQFQPLLNSDVKSVREFALTELDSIVTGDFM